MAQSNTLSMLVSCLMAGSSVAPVMVSALLVRRNSFGGNVLVRLEFSIARLECEFPVQRLPVS